MVGCAGTGRPFYPGFFPNALVRRCVPVYLGRPLLATGPSSVFTDAGRVGRAGVSDARPDGGTVPKAQFPGALYRLSAGGTGGFLFGCMGIPQQHWRQHRSHQTFSVGVRSRQRAGAASVAGRQARPFLGAAVRLEPTGHNRRLWKCAFRRGCVVWRFVGTVLSAGAAAYPVGGSLVGRHSP